MQERVFVARHMRNLSLRMMEAGHHICRQLDPVLEPTWGGLISHMQDGTELNVTAGSKLLGVSHVRTQKLLRSMLEAGVVSARDDPQDGRSTLYGLTPAGMALVPVVDRITGAVAAVLDDIEQETGDNLTAALASFTAAIEARDWETRITEKLNSEKEKNDET